MFKTYKRKIDMYCRNPDGSYRYVWTTIAYPTCKAAVAGALQKCPAETFKARFRS